MGCSCDKNINCDNGTQCYCGITLKLRDSSGALIENLQGTGYDPGTGEVIYQFQSGTVFPTGVLTMTYNSTLKRWELRHTDPSLYSPDDSILFGTYGTDALCPDTDCDLDLTCNTLNFLFAGVSVGDIEWQGDMYNGKKLYRLNASDYSGVPGWGNVIIYWGNNLAMQNNNGITANRWLFILLGNYTLETIPFPLEQINSTGSSLQLSQLGYLYDGSLGCSDGAYQAPESYGGAPPRVSTVPSGPQGYTGVIERVDCGCCDEKVTVSIKDGVSSELKYTANVTRDVNENILGHNGIQYYVFNDGTEDLYIYFNGTAWVVGDSFSQEDYVSTSSGDCPYGFYTTLPAGGTGSFKIIEIRGVECFDCCDYYTPRFTNFIRKQRSILVDETSYIRSKEVFGLQCGGDWQDIFRKHLIIDTLSCLPDGVLCEEQEECLIENLYKNCNC